MNAFIGSGSYAAAIASAILTTGGMHAPIAQTIEVIRIAMQHVSIQEDEKFVLGYTDTGARIPGWGNSFIKGAEDDLWIDFQDVLKDAFPEIYKAVRRLTLALHHAGKDIYPNPSAFTAATAIALGIPPVIAPFIFFRGRLDAWTQVALKTHQS